MDIGIILGLTAAAVAFTAVINEVIAVFMAIKGL